jgi:uncharacterized protein (TIGR03437 family)
VNGPATLRLLLAAFFVSVVCGQMPQNIVVTSSASFQGGLPPAGSIGAIFCMGLQVEGIVTAEVSPLPMNLGGISVEVGGVPAPILAVADDGGYQQINFQVPQGIVAPQNITTIVVSQNRNQGNALIAFSTSPGDFFVLPGGRGAFQHADYSLVTPQNPAQPGEIIVGYLTGLHGTNPGVPAGEPSPQSPLAVVHQVNQMGDVDFFGLLLNGTPIAPNSVSGLDNLFLGLSPGLVGVYQVNFMIPFSAAPGNTNVQLQRFTCASIFGTPCGVSSPVAGTGVGCTSSQFVGQFSSACNSSPVLLPIQ